MGGNLGDVQENLSQVVMKIRIESKREKNQRMIIGIGLILLAGMAVYIIAKKY